MSEDGARHSSDRTFGRYDRELDPPGAWRAGHRMTAAVAVPLPAGWSICKSCDRAVDPVTFECGCT